MTTAPSLPVLLQPYDPAAAGWTKADAAHLLRRATFGPTWEEVEQAHRAGLAATVERLLTPQPESAEFQAAEPLLRRTGLDSGSIDDLKAWWLYRMTFSANPLVEKMTLLWHNHFATSYVKVQSVPAMAAQNDLFRQYALGKFGDLLLGIARDVAMLIWLDGNGNKKRAPNENFARELMELFSLGVGNYTEGDIKEAARAFTGWHVRHAAYWFDRSQHDFGPKTVFGKTGSFDGGDVVGLCLAQPACPRFLALKLLRLFVTSEPDAAMIHALAARLRAHDLALSPVLRELLQSRLFFSAPVRGNLIKGPIDFVLGADRALEVHPNLVPTIKVLESMGQDIFAPPTVKGWEGGRQWVNSAVLLQRTQFAAELVGGTTFGALPDPAKDVVKYQLADAPATVSHYLDRLLGRPVDAAVRRSLTAFYAQGSSGQGERLRGLIQLIVALPEYQLA